MVKGGLGVTSIPLGTLNIYIHISRNTARVGAIMVDWDTMRLLRATRLQSKAGTDSHNVRRGIPRCQSSPCH